MLADSISEEKKEFAETLPFGVVILNADKRIVWLNRLACGQLYCEPGAGACDKLERIFSHDPDG
ncbi:hypothetical protein LJK87_21765 [Paenibacillus sp. P25]|nr:hypothetical protein LJK87_21765 [Paenibacillus sp. P25]